MTTTFHPSLREYFKRFGIGRALLIVGLLIFLFSRTGLGGLLTAMIILVIVFGVVLFAMKRRTLAITETHLHYFDGLSNRTQIPLEQVTPVVYLPNYHNFNYGLTKRLIIARDKKPFMVVTGLFWSEDTVSEIVKRLESVGVKVLLDNIHHSDMSITEQYGTILGYFHKFPTNKAFVWTAILTVVGIVLLTLLVMVFPDIADALDSFWYRVEFTFRSLLRIPS